MLVGADMHLRGRAPLARHDRRSRVRDPVEQDDPTIDVARQPVDEFGLDPIERARAREGVRDAGQGLSVELEPSPAGEADVRIVQQQLGRIAARGDLLLDPAQALELRRCPRMLRPARELTDDGGEPLARDEVNRVAEGRVDQRSTGTEPAPFATMNP